MSAKHQAPMMTGAPHRPDCAQPRAGHAKHPEDHTAGPTDHARHAGSPARRVVGYGVFRKPVLASSDDERTAYAFQAVPASRGRPELQETRQ